MSDEKDRWYHYLVAGAFLLAVGAMVVYGFGEMWLGWDPCPGPDDPFGLGYAEPCTGDESIMPIVGGLFAPMVLILLVFMMTYYAVVQWRLRRGATP